MMLKALALASVLAFAQTGDGCGENATPVSSSGISKADVKVPVGSNGLTAEQTNIHDRLLKDNEPGSIKYLYIISQYTGDVLMFSTVRGKVTSGGKRLTPLTVSGKSTASTWCNNGFSVMIGNEWFCTQEVLQDDGTYGSSGEYIYWWDTKGVYRQLGVNSSLWMVSDQPMTVRHTVLNLDNLEQSQNEEDSKPVVLPTKPATSTIKK
ncbi:MAG: hypothetical protein KGH64_04325 [Candidatus Micrarchaeota archaeon]|nr:hypothetical protein [Candidatus Micrarchaeota archaeon]